MFKLLRSKAKIFYWVIAASFILFIFLAWGMQYSGSRNARQQDPGLVGSVNGLPISAYQWDNTYRNYVARMQQQNQDQTLTANQRARAYDQVWEMLVRDRLEEDAIRDLELTAQPDEILDILRRSPPPELLQRYTDESGNPNLEAYYADLNDPTRDWSAVEEYLRHQVPRQKLFQLIVAGASVTEDEIRDTYDKQIGRVVVEYLGVLFSELEVETEPTAEEIEAFYNSHIGLYQDPAKAKLHIMAWPKDASESDRQAVLEDAQDIKADIEAGDYDFAEAAAIYSQDESNSENGGDLGFFDRNRMVGPFTEAAFSMPVGQLSDPLETRYGYHLIEIIEQRVEADSVTEVHARHILLNIEPGQETLTNLHTQAGEFRDRAASGDFLTVAAGDSLHLRAPAIIAKGRDLPGLGNSMEASNLAFQMEPGEISPVLENEENFYLVYVEELYPEGPKPLSEVNGQVTLRVKQEQKRVLAAAKLSPAVGAIQMGGSFAEVAEEFGLLHAVTDTITGTSNISDVGYNTAFNAVALEVEAGTLVPEVETSRGLFALRTIWREPFVEADYLALKDNIRLRLLSQKQRELQEAWYETRREEADIDDNRYSRLLGGA